jgi:hypothetical protein
LATGQSLRDLFTRSGLGYLFDQLGGTKDKQLETEVGSGEAEQQAANEGVIYA